MRQRARLAELVRSPVAQSLGVGLLLFAALTYTSDRLADGAAEAEALHDARSATFVLARSVAEPSLTKALVEGDPGATDRFDRKVRSRLTVGDVRRIKLWADDGTIIWSDQPDIIGSRFSLDEEELEILHEGGTDAELSDLSAPENALDQDAGPLVEVYTQVVADDGTPLLFEAYYSTSDIELNSDQVFGPFRKIMLGSLLAFGALALVMIWSLSRRLNRGAEERERLLRAAVDASDAERRRIARDLHDGVVQDIAGTAFALSAAAREDHPVAPSAMADAARSLRGSLRALRSLLVEIHPPDLDAEGLPAALDDLVAPAAAAGMTANVNVDGVSGASDPAVRLVWRVAQEAVRNAMRHSRGSRLDVDVRRRDDRVILVVRDDGIGLDQTRPPAKGHVGLRGMSGLARDAGGHLDVASEPGGGTTVTLEVGA